MNKIAKITAVSVVVAAAGLTAVGATAGWGEGPAYPVKAEATRP